jgi:hypothetical protein
MCFLVTRSIVSYPNALPPKLQLRHPTAHFVECRGRHVPEGLQVRHHSRPSKYCLIPSEGASMKFQL